MAQAYENSLYHILPVFLSVILLNLTRINPGGRNSSPAAPGHLVLLLVALLRRPTHGYGYVLPF